MTTPPRWFTDTDDGHSTWYVEHFRRLASEGSDLAGEARFIDAMAAPGSRILDAGCGPGRVGGRLAELGHDVVGVDIDPALIAAAEHDHPGPRWLHGDLSTLDLPAVGIEAGFDVIVVAGNVMAFLDPATRRMTLERLGAHLAPQGRIAVGFGAGRDYGFDEFLADVTAAGLRCEVTLATWDLRPSEPSSDFLVAVLGAA